MVLCILTEICQKVSFVCLLSLIGEVRLTSFLQLAEYGPTATEQLQTEVS